MINLRLGGQVSVPSQAMLMFGRQADPRRPQGSPPGEGATHEHIRILVGTRKGAFVLTSDGKRRRWDISGPHFAGWEIYHVKGSPVDPNRLYASQTSGWFGQKIQRSDDGGKTWEPVGDKFAYDGVPGTHQWYDGTQHPWEFKRVWHLEPSLTDPDTVYAGVEDAALFRSRRRRPDLGGTSRPAQRQRPPLAARRRRHVPAHHPSGSAADPERIFIAISAAGVFRTDDARQDVAAGQPRPEVPATSSPTRTPRSATASTASPCTPRARTCCSCRSIGT